MKLLEYLLVLFSLLARTGGAFSAFVTADAPPPSLYSMVNGFFLIGGTACALMYLLNHLRAFGKGLSMNYWLFSLMLLAYFSTIWSGDPEFTFFQSTRLFENILFAIYLGLRFSREEVNRHVHSMLLIILGSSILLTIFMPALAVQLDDSGHIAWRGVMGHKNTLAPLLTLTILYTFYGTRFKRSFKWLIIMVCVLGLVACRSFSTLFFTAILLPFCFAARFFYNRSRQFAYFYIGVIALSLVSLGFFSYYILIGFFDGVLFSKDLTSLTGRTFIWDIVKLIVGENALIGHGYFGYWAIVGSKITEDASSQLLGWSAGNAHNTFLQILIDLGFLGLLLWVLSLVKVIRVSVKHLILDKSNASLLFFSVILFALLQCLTEYSLLNVRHFNWQIFLIQFYMNALLLESERSEKKVV